MTQTNLGKLRVLHVWDTKMDSGLNIDDLLEKAPLIQRASVRVLVGQGDAKPIDRHAQHTIESILSPYPANPILRLISKSRFRLSLKREIKSFMPDAVIFHFGQTAATD